jgi:hypothetical protein
MPVATSHSFAAACNNYKRILAGKRLQSNYELFNGHCDYPGRQALQASRKKSSPRSPSYREETVVHQIKC